MGADAAAYGLGPSDPAAGGTCSQSWGLQGTYFHVWNPLPWNLQEEMRRSLLKEMWIVIAKVLVASLNYSNEECTKALMN